MQAAECDRDDDDDDDCRRRRARGVETCRRGKPPLRVDSLYASSRAGSMVFVWLFLKKINKISDRLYLLKLMYCDAKENTFY